MQDVAVNVFWDIENCAVPTTMKGVQVVNAIRSFALQRGVLKNISAFANLKLLKDDLRADLQESGVLLHDVARKVNSSDLAILVEILKLVIDNKPPHCIVLISGDRDFANILSTLIFRKYLVYLIHSPQASEVLRNAATDAFEWTNLIKRGGETSLNPPLQPLNVNPVPQMGLLSQYDKFQPLVDFLVQKGKLQVQFSELGNLIPFAKFGYPKLKDYIFAAQDAGLVKCGANKNIHWVSLLLNGHDRNSQLGQVALNCAISPTSRGPDRKQLVKYLSTALESLKKDYFKPTEGTLQKRIKQMSLPLQMVDWEEVISTAKANLFVVEGDKPNRTIYPPSGPFDGVDPSHPCSDKFPSSIWKSLQQFLASVHPIIRVGRYGFAVFLHEEGPMEIREMPLGAVTELVQLSLHKQLLRYSKTQVSTISPDEDIHSYSSTSIQDPVIYYDDDYRPSSPLLPDGADDEMGGLIEDERARMVPVSFVWPYFGKSVLVTGSFFNWRNTIALHRYDNEPGYGATNSNNNNNNNNGVGSETEEVFSAVLYLPPGKYEYKFVVDGAWHYDPKQPVVTDETGNLNNFLFVEEPIPRDAEPSLNNSQDDYIY